MSGLCSPAAIVVGDVTTQFGGVRARDAVSTMGDGLALLRCSATRDRMQAVVLSYQTPFAS